MGRTRKQHYVPQTYLRGFLNAKKRIWCFDKKTDRIFDTNLADIASERDFYEVPQLPVNKVEETLGVLETNWPEMLKALLEGAGIGRIGYRQAIDFAEFVVIQWMRTKTFRDIGLQIMEQAGQRVVDQLTELNFPGTTLVPRYVINKDSMPGVHAQKLFEVDKAREMAKDLERLLWIVGVNETAHSFYTSDQSVVRRGNCKHADGYPMLGPHDPGLEFFFPLDKKHILLMKDRTRFASLKSQENKLIRLTEEEVADCNSVMVMRSNQRVDCAANDFDLAKKVCVENPQVRDPNRPRVLSGNTPVDAEMRSFLWVRVLE